MAKKDVKHPALKTFAGLNDCLRDAGEPLCKMLLKQELTGRNRRQFKKRIHSRLNKVRADREREELGVS